jgi:hypothetical protein
LQCINYTDQPGDGLPECLALEEGAPESSFAVVESDIDNTYFDGWVSIFTLAFPAPADDKRELVWKVHRGARGIWKAHQLPDHGTGLQKGWLRGRQVVDGVSVERAFLIRMWQGPDGEDLMEKIATKPKEKWVEEDLQSLGTITIKEEHVDFVSLLRDLLIHVNLDGSHRLKPRDRRRR